MLTVWAILLLVNMPPEVKTSLYILMVLKVTVEKIQDIPRWDLTTLAQRTEVPPLGFNLQVCSVLDVTMGESYKYQFC